ncbi:hypothetical protein P167DRAFT_576308, partial [Morchella conica CCBAS932]
ATPVQVPVVPVVPPAQAYGGYHAPTPPQGYVPPPPPPPPPQQQAQDPAKAALIQQVLSLTPEQIGALPADQQSQIMMLKHQILAGGGF